MRVDGPTVQLACKQRDEIYGKRWPIKDFCQLWQWGERAFCGTADRASFDELEGILRRYWQVFRGPLTTAPDPEHAFWTIGRS